MCLVARIRLTKTTHPLCLRPHRQSSFTDTTFVGNEAVLDTSYVGWAVSQAGALLATTSPGQYPYIGQQAVTIHTIKAYKRAVYYRYKLTPRIQCHMDPLALLWLPELY